MLSQSVMRDLQGQETAAIIGVDVGATSIAGGLVTPQGDVPVVIQKHTHPNGRGSAADQLFGVIAELLVEARARGVALKGVGVGLPGIVNTEAGMMTGETNLVPELARIPIAARIREQTGLPAWVDNDVNALALGEARYGIGRDANALVVLAIGTGVGGAVIIDHTLVRGRGGYGGEFGHVTVMLNGPRCMCGGHGCLCRFVGGAMLADEARLRVRDRPDSKILVLAGADPAAVTAKIVFQAAEAGDDVAHRMVDEACEALAAGLGGVLNSLNPDLVVITGGVVKSLLPLQQDILRRAGKYAFARVLADTTIRLLPSDKASTMRGAAALFLYESERRAQRSAPAKGQ